MDVDGAVAAAMAVSREHNFITDIGTRWKLYFSKRDLPLTGSVDGTKMQAFVAGIAKDVDVAAVDAGLSIENGQIKVIESVVGKAVDQTGLVEQLNSLLVSLHSTTVEVPVAVTEPKVTAEDNAEAQKQAEIMISGPVAVTGGGQSWTVTAEQIASYMGFTSEIKDGISILVPKMDATKLQPLLAQIDPLVATQPVDATFAHDDTKAWVVEGKDGETLDPDATAKAITEATLKESDRTVAVITMKKEPEFSTADAEAMGIKDKLSSYTTTYSCPTPRQINVKLCTKYATGMFLAPGEEYNFDKQIGPRTVARGWQLAPGIVGPNQLEDVLGGGICQVSTTMFNAAAGGAAGLDITERHNHSLFISHYPKGRDATVTGGGKNLRFKNDMEHSIWITGTSTGVTTTITIFGTDEGRTTEWTVGSFYGVTGMAKTTVTDPKLAWGKTSLVESGQTGKALKTTRVVKKSGAVIHNTIWTSVWPMYPEIRAVPSSTTTTLPPETTTTTAPPGP
jgi:vancomycin resistance protein YoaR